MITKERLKEIEWFTNVMTGPSETCDTVIELFDEVNQLRELLEDCHYDFDEEETGE
jgi:iron-sulfur cluster repair protein YtfE (RIC family)